MPIDHDRLFKELLTVFFAEFVELCLPEVYAWLDVDSVRFLDKEIFTDVTDGESHEADLVAMARFRGGGVSADSHRSASGAPTGFFAAHV